MLSKGVGLPGVHFRFPAGDPIGKVAVLWGTACPCSSSWLLAFSPLASPQRAFPARGRLHRAGAMLIPALAQCRNFFSSFACAGQRVCAVPYQFFLNIPVVMDERE